MCTTRKGVIKSNYDMADRMTNRLRPKKEQTSRDDVFNEYQMTHKFRTYDIIFFSILTV